MFRSRIPRFRRSVIALATVTCALALSNTPAFAATVGGGTGLWTYASAPSTSGFCGIFTSAVLNSGAPLGYSGQYNDGTNTYDGDLVFSANATETFFGNPTGDIYSDATCTTPKPSVNVAATVSTGPTHKPGSVSISCSYTGSYIRPGPGNYVLNLAGTCSVNGAAAVNMAEIHNGAFVVPRLDKLPPDEVPTPCGKDGPPKYCAVADTYVARTT